MEEVPVRATSAAHIGVAQLRSVASSGSPPLKLSDRGAEVWRHRRSTAVADHRAEALNQYRCWLLQHSSNEFHQPDAVARCSE